MTWTTPRTWTTGEIVTASMMNTHVRDNMAETVHRIAETILLSDTASPITFSSISGAYRHLSLEINARSSRATSNDSYLIRLNGDSGANYNSLVTSQSSIAVSATDGLSQTSIQGWNLPGTSATAGRSSATRVFIPDYARTTYHKNVYVDAFLFVTGGTGGTHWSVVAVWTSTAAITSISIYALTGPNFLAGSTFTLYGHS